MKGKNKQEWIEHGYQMVSEKSFTNVNVESLARVIKKNKSSFYYYFGDWSGFENALLEHHLKLAKQFAIDTDECQSIIPDLVDLFVKYRTDIFFHKQLRINRTNPHFKKCFESVYKLFENAVLDKWNAFLGMENHSMLAEKFLTILSENFLLRITHENFNESWIKDYMIETSKLMQNINPHSSK